RPVRLDPETFGILRAARRVWEESDGAFDITMAGLMRRLGLHDGSSSARAEETWGMDALVLDEPAHTVAFARAAMSIDLGAIGKGHALDAAAAVVREAGIATALLHGGTSSVVGIGAPEDQPGGWRVALGEAGTGAPVVILRDRALSVSGQHGRTVERAGK